MKTTFLILYAFIALTSTPSFAQTTFQEKIIISDNYDEERFGYSIALDGDTLVASSPFNYDTNSPPSVYIFERNQGGGNNWGLVKILSSIDSNSTGQFGFSISLYQDTLVIGDRTNDTLGFKHGSVFIFERNHGGTNNWGEIAQIEASDAATSDFFGWGLDIYQDTIVVGSSRDDENCTNDPHCNSGSAYIFERNHGGVNNWGEVKKIMPSDPQDFNYFGQIIKIDGSTIVIGVYKKEAVYIFERNHGGVNNWGERVKLVNPDSIGAQFDMSVSIDNNIVAVGFPGVGNGFVRVYERDLGGLDNWGEVIKLEASDGGGGDEFGRTVSVNLNTILVGAPSEEEMTAGNSGAVYLFEQNVSGNPNWEERNKLKASNRGHNDHFGRSISHDNSTIVVGAPWHDNTFINSGSVYVYTDSNTISSSLSRWSFDENTGCIANDSKGSSDGVLGPDCSQNNAPDWAPGKIGSALDFSSASDLVEIPSDNLQSDKFTITAWVKADTLRNYRTVFMNSTSGSWSDGFGLFYSTINGLTFFVNNINNKVSAPITLGAWTHYSVSYDGAELAIYVNGNLVQVFPYSQPINYPNPITAPFQIGKGAGSVTSYGWSGSIDEVNYFDSALSGTEILDIFNQDILPSNTSVNLAFDENIGCVAFDDLGTHDGSLGPSCNSGNGPNWVPGKINSALDFDGIDDVVEIAMDSDLQSSHITVAACIKPETLGNWDTVIMNASSNSWADGYGIYYLPTTGINFYVNQYSTNKVSAQISTGVWTHIAATYNLVEIKLYINGVLSDTLPYSQFISYPNPSTPLVIGKGPGGATANAWDGAIDQVYVAGNAKSDAEIYNIYLEQCSEFIFIGSFE